MTGKLSDRPERIIWCNGLPRSGTSWLCQILDSSPDVEFRLAPLFSWEFRNTITKDASEPDWIKFFRSVYNSDDHWMRQLDRRRTGKFPTFQNKTLVPPVLVIKDVRHHEFIEPLLELSVPIQILHIVRDPRAAIHSWLDNPKEFPEGADPMTNWRTGEVRKTSPSEYWGFNDWVKLTKMYEGFARSYPMKVKVIKYEELVDDPIGCTRSVFEWLRLGWSEQTESFLKASTSGNSTDPFSVYKDPRVKGRWRSELSNEIRGSIEMELRDTGLETYLCA